MAKLLRMPEISANATEAVLQEWSVQENTPFAADDTIATIETDKAAVDIEAEADGVIIKMLVTAGAAVEVGSPIALLGDPKETVADLDALLAELGVAATVPSDRSQNVVMSRTTPRPRAVNLPTVRRCGTPLPQQKHPCDQKSKTAVIECLPAHSPDGSPRTPESPLPRSPAPARAAESPAATSRQS